MVIDLETGESFVIRNGDLSKAILISAAFPYIIDPVEIKAR